MDEMRSKSQKLFTAFRETAIQLDCTLNDVQEAIEVMQKHYTESAKMYVLDEKISAIDVDRFNHICECGKNYHVVGAKYCSNCGKRIV